MYSRKALAWLTAAVTSLALTAGAYGQGKSPNGPPGPEGNPNQPQQSQGNPPPGPQGNPEGGGGQENAPAKQQSAPNGKAKGHSKPAPPRSNPNSKSKSNQRNPNPGTPRKGGREDRPSPKITICHATGSESNPYVEITISENGLNGHGDHHKGDGRWDDIIPAPAGGCPGGAAGGDNGGADTDAAPQGGTNNTENTTATTPLVQPERATDTGQQGVLGARAEGGSPGAQGVLGEQAEGGPAGGSEGGGGVLGAAAEGGADAPAAARETRRATVGSLPFTGFELAFILITGLATLLGGFALRRAVANGA